MKVAVPWNGQVASVKVGQPIKNIDFFHILTRIPEMISAERLPLFMEFEKK